MPDTTDNAIVVKRQNFDKAMTSIKVFADNAKEHEPLDRVSYSGGFLGLGDHKVTGSELNNVVSQVEDQLIDLKDFDLGTLNIITDIYKALDALDKEHISGILIAANAAKVASDKATKNVEAIQKIIKVLQDFKEKLDKLEHLMDVDKAWELLEEQKKLLIAFGDYKDALSKIKHLKDVDNLWNDKATQANKIAFLEKKIGEIGSALEKQSESICNFTKIVESISESQQAFIESTNQQLSERQVSIDHHLEERERYIQEKFTALSNDFNSNKVVLNKKIEELSKTQAETLDSLKRAQSDQMALLEKSQADKLSLIESNQVEHLNDIQRLHTENLAQLTEAQSAAFEKMENTQTERLDKITQEQTDTLAQIAKEQVESLRKINTSLEEEKIKLNETVSLFSQKAKIAYIVAGSSVAITVIHILLNILGVL